ncbi:NADPH-dependent FMN reductase [Sphingosinicella soli]|uniref:FMN reductase n=1 Tax=Sphingosinicella soli TaxID=333708 RepID=A0A7W7F8P3_9SPHN|nr:NADPH-dependent FMN reductase [Sphingosinicella soli]MBB4633949.1 FMN reductase [Sphingosinicella soli]
MVTIVGIGGTPREGSSTERALSLVLRSASDRGAAVTLFGGQKLAKLPLFNAEMASRSPEQLELVETARRADGRLIASPGYHGSISGLVKNGLDTLEDLREDKRPYLDRRAVGCIVNAFGWQACGTTLSALRSIVHALRGWPTPYGATLNSTDGLFDDFDECKSTLAEWQLTTVSDQVLRFALAQPMSVCSQGSIPDQHIHHKSLQLNGI